MAAKKSSKQVALDELSATVARLEKTVAKLEKRLDKHKDETKKVADAAKDAARQAAGEIEKVARRAEKQVRKAEKKLRKTAESDEPSREQSGAGVAEAVDGAVDGIAADLLAHESAQVTVPTTPIEAQEPEGESMAAPTPAGTTMDPDWAIEQLTLAELRALARERGLTGYSRKTKQQLLAELG